VIGPITLGNRIFPVNIIQGPLAGISSAPFRLLSWRYGQPALVYTEMVSCKTLIHQSRNSVSNFVRQLPGEGPLGVQLSGTSSSEIGEAVKIATDAGAATIDLNCGCPVKKIRKRGAGSAHLSEPSRLYQLIVAMKQNTNLPVSIKIRVDGDSSDAFNQEIAKVISDAGLDFLIVHGRHWSERYDQNCRHDEIRSFVNELNIPVIGNGDIACMDSLQQMFATGCAGVMIGRASVGQPWLVKNLVTEAAGRQPVHPTAKERGNIFYEHVMLLADFLGSEIPALLQARKFCKYYARNMADIDKFCDAVNHCTNLDRLNIICRNFFVTGQE